MKRSPLASLAMLAAVCSLQAADWPMYRGDAARSGYTTDALPAQLSLAWKYEQAHSPQPAWPRDDRMLFDRANDVVVAGDLAFFGSSADCRVVALDAKTGKEKWSFFTGGPVRFAPAVWKDRVFAVSDDGYLYCLSAVDGTLVNRWRGGPTDEMILGNGRMVSRWPARGGPAIVGDTVYFAAGVWQTDGVFLQAIDAPTGRVLWTNSDAGKIYMAQPHGGAMAESGVSAQGYLVATAEHLLVPTGRAVPAAFMRESGRFLYYHLQANGHTGGTQAIVAGPSFYNGGARFKLSTGVLEGKVGPGPVAAVPEGILHATKNEVRLVKLVEKMVPDRKGVPVKTLVHESAWSVPEVDGSTSLIVAGNTIVAGGAKTITTVDAKTKQPVWTTEVDGIPYGLAAAGERLYVSTDRGTIYCFDGGQHAAPAIVRTSPIAAEEAKYAAAADEILRRTGVKEGFALDIDAGDCGLAMALAQRSKLHVYALCSSAEQVQAARQKLLAAGLYGVRVTVHQGDADNIPYGKYFADLVVSSASLASGPVAQSAASPLAVLRPFGGQACTGKPGAMQVFTRGALAKSGSWTHQYSDLGNTGASTDEIVKGELHSLWFRDVDLEMPNRHGRGHAPLFHAGRMFVEGIGALRAVDAYNGRNLWEFPLPGVQKAYSAEHLSGTAVTGSNFCLGGDSVYVHDKQHCYRLDAATGKKLGQFAPPPGADGKPGQWGYIACDGKLLFSSLSNPEHHVRYAYGRSDMSQLAGESKTLFVLSAQSGELLWRYDATESIRHNTIAVGKDRVFLIDRKLADEDKLRLSTATATGKLPPVEKVTQPAGTLIALDSATGKPLWKAPEAFGTVLVYSAEQDALVMCYQSTRFKLPSEVGGRIAAFRGRTGEKLWDKAATYVTRPLINGPTIYAQGGAWDLASGEDRPFTLKRSYGCGQIAASKNMLLFRSATLGYLDLTRGSDVENFGGIRPGCWINALPVGGLVLVPDASAGCVCSYQNRSWMALSGDDDE